MGLGRTENAGLDPLIGGKFLAVLILVRRIVFIRGHNEELRTGVMKRLFGIGNLRSGRFAVRAKHIDHFEQLRTGCRIELGRAGLAVHVGNDAGELFRRLVQNDIPTAVS